MAKERSTLNDVKKDMGDIVELTNNYNNARDHVDAMMGLTQSSLLEKLKSLKETLEMNITALEGNQLDFINGLGIIQDVGHEIDVLASRLNSYRTTNKVLKGEQQI